MKTLIVFSAEEHGHDTTNAQAEWMANFIAGLLRDRAAIRQYDVDIEVVPEGPSFFYGSMGMICKITNLLREEREKWTRLAWEKMPAEIRLFDRESIE